MRLQDIMTRDVETIGPEEAADVAWSRMRREAIHHLVVTDDGSLIGIISDRDLGGTRGQAQRRGHVVRDLMTESIVTATPDATLRRAANLMRGRTLGCLPVVERGKLKGIVTVSDLLELVGRGATRPVAQGKRWTLRHRGPRRRRTPVAGTP